MTKSKVDEYIQQGIHGALETKPDERKKFLGTIRERVVIALTTSQVREDKVYQEVIDACKANPKAHLYLNGNMDYRFLSKYVKVANQHRLQYTLVSNKEYNSELGLVLAYDYAIDKEDIYVTKKEIYYPQQEQKKNNQGLFSIFKKVFKK